MEEKLFLKNGDAIAGRTSHLRKILVPLDFSNRSMVGLEYAIGLGETSRTELVLLNTVSVPSFALYGAYGDRGLTAANHYAWLTAEKQMSQLHSALVSLGIDAETVVESGVPSHQICLYAQNHEMDVIITATHGKTELEDCLLGSTAEQILRHAPCPVLLVPSKGKSCLQSDGRKISERDIARFAMQTNTRRAAMTSLQRFAIG